MAYVKKYILLTLLLLVPRLYWADQYKPMPYSKELRILEIKRSEFDIELLKEYLYLTDTTGSDVPMRQFILETGWFTSGSFTEHNNLSGMKHPANRETTSIGEEMSHASYEHWTKSVDDYMLWRKNYTDKGYDISDYYKFLRDVGYSTSNKYEERLKQIKINRWPN